MTHHKTCECQKCSGLAGNKSSGEYVRRSDDRDLVALDIAANASGLHAMGALGRVVIDLASCERALATAHTQIADQSTTIEAAFRAKCEAERALESARAEVERLRKGHCRDCCCERAWAALDVHCYTGKSIAEHITALRARVAELEGAVRDVTKGVVFKEYGGEVWLVPARPWNYIIVTPATAAVLRSVAKHPKKDD